MLNDPNTALFVAYTGLALCALSLCVTILGIVLHLRLRRAPTARFVAREFADLGGQIDTLTNRFSQMESNIDWLAEDRMIDQAISIARTDLRSEDRLFEADLRAVEAEFPRRRPH